MTACSSEKKAGIRVDGNDVGLNSLKKRWTTKKGITFRVRVQEFGVTG